MNEENILDNLKNEGYKEVYIWEDVPGFIYDKHCHEYETKLVIVSGEIEIEINSNKLSLNSGDSIIIPAWAYHTARVGKIGCKYAVGEGK